MEIGIDIMRFRNCGRISRHNIIDKANNKVYGVEWDLLQKLVIQQVSARRSTGMAAFNCRSNFGSCYGFD